MILREGMQKLGRASQETIMQLWGTVLFLTQEICIIICPLIQHKLNPPPRWWSDYEWWGWHSRSQSTKAWALPIFSPILCWILFCSNSLRNMHLPDAENLAFVHWCELNLRGRVLSKEENNSFTALQGKGKQQACALKNCLSQPGRIWRGVL